MSDLKRQLDITRIARPNILRMKPYSSARSEFTGKAEVFLDANENYKTFVPVPGRNRYPDPLQRNVKAEIAKLFKLDESRIFLGNGSDEAIDLLYRAFAEPGRDRVVILPPTYGVYKVFAELNDIQLVELPLNEDFQLPATALESLLNEEQAAEALDTLKLLFICSPNNPTGNAIAKEAIIQVLESFPGLVVVDQAYQDFSEQEGCEDLLEEYENLVILRTLSKAWGLANARLGMAFASPAIISLLNNCKYPYNISGPAQDTALEALAKKDEVMQGVFEIRKARELMQQELLLLDYVEKVYPSDANFILVKVKDASKVYNLLKEQGVVIRNRTHEYGCYNCVRITVGSAKENRTLLETMKSLEGTV